TWRGWRGRRGVLMDYAGTPDRLRFEPVLLQNCPQSLVQMLAVADKRPPQHALLHRSELSQRAVAASVSERRTRFQPMHAQNLEREVDDQFGAVDEHAETPEFRRQRETPLRSAKGRLERAHLEDTDRCIRSVRHDGEAHILASLPLSNRPIDEASEAIERRG